MLDEWDAAKDELLDVGSSLIASNSVYPGSDVAYCVVAVRYDSSLGSNGLMHVLKFYTNVCCGLYYCSSSRTHGRPAVCSSRTFCKEIFWRWFHLGLSSQILKSPHFSPEWGRSSNPVLLKWLFYQKAWRDGVSWTGDEFEWTFGVGEGQGGLACSSPWGRKESDMTEQLNWTEYKNKKYK